MEKKFKLSEVSLRCEGKVLRRIIALMDIPKYNVKKGDLGGYVEKEENLSQVGICWISNDAKVYGNAKVVENSLVCENAKVKDNAMIRHYAKVSGNAVISGNAVLCEESWVFENAKVSNITQIFGKAWIFGKAEIGGNVAIGDDACVFGNAKLYHGIVRSNALIKNDKNFIYINAFNHNLTFFTTANKICVVENNTLWSLEDWEIKRSTHSDELKTLSNMVKNYFVVYSDKPYPSKEFVKKRYRIQELELRRNNES